MVEPPCTGGSTIPHKIAEDMFMKIKQLFTFTILFATICLFIGCTPHPNVLPTPSAEITSDFEDAWNATVSLPFSGYICGIADSSTLLQFLVLVPSPYSLTLTPVSKIELLETATGDTLSCESYGIIGGSGTENWSLYTLTFKAKLPQPGVYTVDAVKIYLSTGSTILLPQNSITLDVLDNTHSQADFLNTQLKINHGSYDRFTFALKNLTTQTFQIEAIDCGLKQYKEVIDITKYMNFELEPVPNSENNNLLYPDQERTFRFIMECDTDFFSKTENQFLIILPKLFYTDEADQLKITPAQTQASVITPTLKNSYLDAVIEAASLNSK